MNKTFLILIFIFCTFQLFAQISDNSLKSNSIFSANKKSKIVEVKIVDSFLLEKLDSLIESYSNNSRYGDEFRKLGFINLTICRNNYRYNDSLRLRFCVAIHWNLNVQLISDSDNQFPDFYTIRKNKLVQIFSQGWDQSIATNFSKRTKKRYIKIQYKYTPRPKPIKIKLGSGKPKLFDPNGSIMVGTDFTICYPFRQKPFTKKENW
jgi:hypothetical protein